MGEAVVACAKCDARQAFRGTSWEVKVMADMWQNEHERAGHDGDEVSAGLAFSVRQTRKTNSPASG